MTGWTDERVADLKRLWADGLSCSQIARRLGDTTRNAVISKVHRIGLAGRETTRALVISLNATRNRRLAERRVPKKPAAVRAVATTKAQPIPPPQKLEPMPRDDGSLVTIANARQGECRFPYGDPRGGELTLCGRKAAPGQPYCECHMRETHVATHVPVKPPYECGAYHKPMSPRFAEALATGSAW